MFTCPRADPCHPTAPESVQGRTGSHTFLLFTLAFCQHCVPPFFHSFLDELVVGVEVVVEAQEVELRVSCLLGLQHYFKLCSLLAHEIGCALNDGVHFGCWWLGENTHAHVISLPSFPLVT